MTDTNLPTQSIYNTERRVSIDSEIISTYLLKWQVWRWGKRQRLV